MSSYQGATSGVPGLCRASLELDGWLTFTFFVKVGMRAAGAGIFIDDSLHPMITTWERYGWTSQLCFSASGRLTLVSNHPTRYYGNDDLRFIHCSCYHRQPWLGTVKRRDLFLRVLEEVRERYRFVVVGYVVMPDHIHLLISEPERGDPSRVMQAVKQGFVRRVLKTLRRRRSSAQQELFAVGAEHVWQRRFYDFNVRTARKRSEKLRHMHRNPVKRGLVQEPEQWKWSSYRSYAFGEAGTVGINEWGAAVLTIRPSAA